jgi:hypothetical protein
MPHHERGSDEDHRGKDEDGKRAGACPAKRARGEARADDRRGEERMGEVEERPAESILLVNGVRIDRHVHRARGRSDEKREQGEPRGRVGEPRQHGRQAERRHR